MTTFLISYRMPRSYVPGRPGAIGAWVSYFDGIGDHLLDRGNAVFESTALGNCGADTALGGYSLVEADDLESARALVKECPGLAEGGGVEVGVIRELEGSPE